MSGLPPGWRVSTLGEVARWGSGGTPKARTPAFYGGGIPWAVIGDLNDGVVFETATSISEDGLASSAAKWVPAGAVLVAMYGSIGKLGIAGNPLTTNQAIAAAQPDETVVDTKYLFYYLLSERDSLGRAGKGAAQQNIGQGVLKAWPIRLAPLDEQRRIVEILEDHLSRLDAGRSLTASAEKRIAKMRQAARQQAVDSVGSPMVPLAELVARIETGKSLGGSAGPAAEDEWGIIKVSAMTWGEFRPEENKRIPEALATSAYEIRPGDLLVSRANTSVYVGASVLVGDVRPRLLLSDKSLRLVPRAGVDAAWLNEVLRAPRSRAQISALATGTKDSMRNISQSALLSIEVPQTPPEEQDRVLARTRETGDAIDNLNAAVARTKSREARLRRALLIAAFSDRLTGSSSDTERIEELVEAGV